MKGAPCEEEVEPMSNPPMPPPRSHLISHSLFLAALLHCSAASMASAASVLTLTSEDSEIRMGSATLKAACDSAQQPAVVALSCSSSSSLLDAQEGGDCGEATQELGVTHVFRAHLRGVAPTCFGKAYTEPCAASPLSTMRPKLFSCVFNLQGHDAPIVTGPFHATTRVEQLEGMVMGADIFVDCLAPNATHAAQRWSVFNGGDSEFGGSLYSVEVSVQHAGTPLGWLGIPGGSVLAVLAPQVPVSSGEVTTLTLGGTEYTRHVFTSSGTIKLFVKTLMDVLIVGGGGGCGYSKYHNGGGGAGGLVLATSLEVAAGTYEIMVGQGGKGAPTSGAAPENGEDSSAFGLVAKGGGAGSGPYSCTVGLDNGGKAGGSGGGGAGSCAALPSNAPYFLGGESVQDEYSGIANVQGYGHKGGTGVDGIYPYKTGGGGGAGGAGANGANGGHGGDGIDLSGTFGVDVGDPEHPGWFAGGGAGGPYDTSSSPGTPGKGGGGKQSSGSGTDGKPNTGGGCGGSEREVQEGGKQGGSGVVILRQST